MKRLILAVAVVLSVAAAAPSFAISSQPPRTVLVVSDVIRMSQAGVGDDEIIAFVRQSREPFDVSADDVIAMTDAQVSRTVIKAVVDEAAARRQEADRADRRDSDRRETVYVAPRVVYGYPSYGPFYSSWYDPYWYGWGPRVTFNFGFGGGFGGGHRGGFHRGRH